MVDSIAHDELELRTLGAVSARTADHGRGSDRDFDAVFHRFAPYVARVLPRMGVASADLDDVMQEVFIAVHRALPGFEGRSSLKSWVYGICIRQCGTYRRRAQRRRTQVALSEAPAAPGTQERELIAARALARLDRVLARLPEAQRAAFVLFEIEGLEMREIAAALGCSKFTLYARLYAARRVVEAGMRAGMKEDEA